MTDKVVGTGMLSFITLGSAAAEDAPKAKEEYKSPLADEEPVTKKKVDLELKGTVKRSEMDWDPIF